MGSKSSGSAPASPNPYSVAKAQTGNNIAAATANSYLNNVNQYTPFGSLTYQQTGTQKIRVPSSAGATGGLPTGGSRSDILAGLGPSVAGQSSGTGYEEYEVPIWSQTMSFSPEQQRLYDQQTQLGQKSNDIALSQIGNATGLLSRTLNPADSGAVSNVTAQNAPTTFGNTAGQIQYGIGDGSDASRQAIEAAVMSRLQPQLDADQRALDARLANQGIKLGSEAYGTAQNIQGRNVNDARMQALVQGYSQAMQEAQLNNAAQQQDYAQQLGRGTFAQSGIGQNNAANLSATQLNNAAQAQRFGQDAATRQQTLAEIAALKGGGQYTMPNFPGYNAAQIQPTDIGNYIYNTANLDAQNYQAQANRDTASNNAFMGGLFGLGSAALMGATGGASGLFGLGGMGLGAGKSAATTGRLY